MGPTLIRALAALPAEATRKEIYAALRAAGASSADARAAGEEYDRLWALRRRRAAARPRRARTLEQRLALALRDLIPWPYRACEGAGSSGNSFRVVRGTPSASSTSVSAWDRTLPKSYRYPVKSSSVLASVSRTWLTHVWRRGLAQVGGLTTLEAVRREDRDGVEVYAAVWVEQGRGVEVRVERGFIARSGSWSHHAASERQLHRAIDARHTAVVARSLASAWAEVVRLGLEEHMIAADVSAQAGNCASGTRDWIARNISGGPARAAASLREIHGAAVQSGDRPEYVARVLALVAARAGRAARAA